MEITVLYVEGCPNLALTRARVEEAIRVAGVTAVVRERLVSDEAEAAALGFAGSPTIVVGGRDLFPTTPAGLACRRYDTDAGYEEAPTVAQLVNALPSAHPRKRRWG